MANQASSLPFELTPSVPVRAAAQSGPSLARSSLAAVELHRPMRVVELALEPEMRDWLRAVGIDEGEEVTLLRRAAFGGPIHVRTSSGGEFAINRGLAKAIFVRLERDAESAA